MLWAFIIATTYVFMEKKKYQVFSVGKKKHLIWEYVLSFLL